MASSSSLIVLTPNGRRVTVKVTPNTSILQVLEDACRKYSLNPVDYDLKHYNRIIEPANSVRFSGLPNNATLEMVQTSRPRQETSINLGLQLESGKRLMHAFQAHNTLWDVIKHWDSAGEPVLPHESIEGVETIQPICVYMRQEIVGQEMLESRTLRSLGLIHGSACIRLLHRTLGQLGVQANVSAPLTRPPSSTTWDSTTTVPPTDTSLNEGHRPPSDDADTSDQIPSTVSCGSRKKRPLSISPLPMETEDGSPGPTLVHAETPTFPLDLSGPPTIPPPVARVKPRISIEGALHFLGDHHALLYHADDVNQPSSTSIPDSFFEVTRGDVEAIYRDLRARRDELEGAPLSTSTLRDQQREEAILRNLQQHPVTIIRVRFVNRYVLQGIFRGVDTIAALMNMVQSHISHPQLPFYLFTSPPKIVLDPAQRLVEAGLVGSAVVYFGSEEISENYLKPEVCQQISCPDAIDVYIQNQGKREKPRIDPVSMEEGPSSGTSTTGRTLGSSPANSGGTIRPITRKTDTSGRIPKWFNPK